METYSDILGLADTPDIAKRLHRLDHEGTLDVVYVAACDLARRRMRVRSKAGRDVAIALPRDTRLSEGAVLRMDAAGGLVVRVEAERWLRVRPADAAAALRVGYHAGNLHWRVKFDGGHLLIGVETDVQTYIDRLLELVNAGQAVILGEEVTA
ncbi:MAG: urease accessory protein UreE [Pseudomonadota bacterium]